MLPFRESRPARPWPLGLLLLVSACATVDLGPSRPLPRPVPVASPPAPIALPAPLPPPAPGSAPVAQTAPVAETAPVLTPALPPPVPLEDGVPAAPSAAASAPYGPAVAARFPDPLVTYKTPAFEPGRDTFTSNAEMHAAIVRLVRGSNQRLGGTQVTLLSLGNSQQGTPLEALLFARSTTSPIGSTPRVIDALAPGRPTVLIIGQQHGDEPAAGEAALVIAQELAGGRLESVLDRINVVVMPRANPDGAEAGRRVAANGIDINRDHLLLRTPEAQAQARLMREFAPIVVVDAHEYTVVGRFLEKFGAVQKYDALLQYATTANLPEFVTKAAEEWFREPLVARLREEGLSSEWYYTTSSDPADRKVSMGGTQPDTGRNVHGLANAVSILVETRGVGLGRLHLKRRVHTQVTAIGSILQSAALRAGDMVKLRTFVDNEVARSACTGSMVVEAAPTPSEYRLVMLDPVTGVDRPMTLAWDSALELRALKTRPRPCGYWIADTESDAAERLRALGLQVLRIDAAGEFRGEFYREVGRETGARQDVRGAMAEPGGVVRLRVQTVPALLDVKPGGYYVPLDQPLANLAIAALEPDTQNSFFANGIVGSVTGQARVLVRPDFRTTPLP